MRIWLVAGAAGLAMLALYAYPTLRPLLLQDDSQILLKSANWQRAWQNLWLPSNEHAMPLGRLSTWLLIKVAGRPTAVPYAAGLQGVIALLAGMGLVYLFVRRELGQPLYGLTAMALFGVSTVYQQAVYWFAASFAVLALDILLLALLAAQRWRQTGQPRALALCVAAAALAPAWFAAGILAGPLCCLYLLISDRKQSSAGAGRLAAAQALVPYLCSLVPLVGSLIFLMVSLPRTAQHILHLEHYQQKTALEAFQPLTGLEYTGRSLVENLALGMFGLAGVELPGWAILVGLGALTAAGWWWWRGVPQRPLLVLGLGLILSSYLLVYSARADWGYAGMSQPNWSRYHLLPQLGLTLFLCGGLPHWLAAPSPPTPLPRNGGEGRNPPLSPPGREKGETSSPLSPLAGSAPLSALAGSAPLSALAGSAPLSPLAGSAPLSPAKGERGGGEGVDGLSRRQARWLLLLIGLLFLINLPRGVLAHWPAGGMTPGEQLTMLWNDPARWLAWTWDNWWNDPQRAEQTAVLRRIEEIDARCRRHRIAADTAREALGWLSIPHCASTENAWLLLRGSDNPLPFTVDEARALLWDLPSEEHGVVTNPPGSPPGPHPRSTPAPPRASPSSRR
ncbi:MAG TPA: hypothetical protein VNK04_27095 [Gemmataceae bacterium]|nr:hypothetical protein [Gemmataceae bacterium]